MLASFCTNLGTIITNTEYVYQFSDPMVEVKYHAKLPNNAKLNITAIAYAPSANAQAVIRPEDVRPFRPFSILLVLRRF